jgi:hypothetical protein
MFRVAFGHHFAQLAHVANSGSETSLQAVAEPFTSLPSARQVDGNPLFSNVLVVAIARL